MKINKHDFTKLKILLEKGTITKSAFKNQDIVDGLKQNGSVKDGKKTPKFRYIDLLKSENIFLFLQQNNYNINSLKDIDSYIEDMFNSSVSRDIIQKHSIFIPKDIEKLVQKDGDSELFKKQLRYENITASKDNIAKLISTIKYYKKGLEQEGLYLF